ncbi:hypothetical protein GobsT_37890 [Gemmata obscuriglobus]|uniref:Uncharacterized protein n=1 Tax=Gemmata obscuriglobus TaxID=114 RepID=A0A2Z3H326_9BACT|nr:hypothetical protein [Gemmata obscuriglobus]AWM38117.1 hypothetical protein C1280_14690 [Gemmata obscuriglobus]QEG29000.1 hypothetical protein GobsT_37890 [Gemmata obscuriglobus]VTS07575.1 unnamed protein product [Gemmata obscuriglobus UQM 2246]
MAKRTRPRQNVAGAKQFNYEIDGALADRFRQFCRDRGETIVGHLEMALRRHMDNPPPVPVLPPLPPVPAPAPPASGAKARGRAPKPKSD